MTGARQRLGFLVGAIVALLCVASLGVWAANNRPPADAPSELARAGIPVSAEDMSLDDPELDEEREEQGEGADERVEAYEEAQEQGKAGQNGKRTYAKAAPARLRRRRRLGRRGPDRHGRRRLGAGHRHRPERPAGSTS